MKNLLITSFLVAAFAMSAMAQLSPGIAGTNQSISYNSVPQPLSATPPTGGQAPYAYKWQSSIDNNSFANILGATDLSYQPGALTASTWYRQVQYSAQPGDSVITNVVSVHVYGMGVGAEQSAVQAVYPNPTTGLVTIVFREGIRATQLSIELFDMNGNRLFLTRTSNGENKQTFSLSGKPAGIYLLQIRNGENTETVRLFKE